ncbi:hypothetical protein M2138_000593 [Dysgonomonadaceae bacterium PH5-43]|nr:hypothetical protein [Dysgonomonadaceae bacterium PH5-43]
MKKEDFRNLLQSVGVNTFIKYFDIFKANSQERSNIAIKDAFAKGGENWTPNSMNTKASIGKKIFLLEKEEDALNYIINGASDAVNTRTREDAKRLAKPAKEILEKRIEYDNNTLTKKFRSRLKTQDRSNNKDKFSTRRFVTLFKNEKFFKEWINKQVDNVIVLSANDEFILEEIKSIYKTADGTWKFEVNTGGSFDLFTRTADGSLRPMSKGLHIDSLVLDHVVSMREILEENRNEMTIITSFKDEHFNEVKEDIKKELRLLDSKIHLQIMEKSENAKKSDK